MLIDRAQSFCRFYDESEIYRASIDILLASERDSVVLYLNRANAYHAGVVVLRQAMAVIPWC